MRSDREESGAQFWCGKLLVVRTRRREHTEGEQSSLRNSVRVPWDCSALEPGGVCRSKQLLTETHLS